MISEKEETEQYLDLSSFQQRTLFNLSLPKQIRKIQEVLFYLYFILTLGGATGLSG